MALTKDQIIKDIRDLLLQLREKHDIKGAYLFGSYARGNPSTHSDVDVAVVVGSLRDGSPFDESFEIFHEVQQYNSLFEVVCFREDEFVKEDTVLLEHIRREGIKIL